MTHARDSAGAAAPLLDAACDAPQGSRAYWLRTCDGVRLRVGCFGHGARGTVLCFPGRTEYVEKYSKLACRLVAAGFRLLVIDWRGQGLADRLLGNPALGHVERFADYQKDVAALSAFATARQMPRPWYLLAHSMAAPSGCAPCRAGLRCKQRCSRLRCGG